MKGVVTGSLGHGTSAGRGFDCLKATTSPALLGGAGRETGGRILPLGVR
jgi:hypothetical protein